jgi:hypothetical protein
MTDDKFSMTNFQLPHLIETFRKAEKCQKSEMHPRG